MSRVRRAVNAVCEWRVCPFVHAVLCRTEIKYLRDVELIEKGRRKAGHLRERQRATNDIPGLREVLMKNSH